MHNGSAKEPDSLHHDKVPSQSLYLAHKHR